MESDDKELSPKSEIDVKRGSSDDRLSEPKTKEIVENLSLGEPSTQDEQIIYDADKALSPQQIEKCTKWIEWFCSIKGHEFLCVIDPKMFEKYDFYKFRDLQRHTYNRAINIITGCKELNLNPVDPEATDKLPTLTELNELYLLSDKNKKLLMAVTRLYGIIHSCYLETADGQNKIHSRFMAGEYGKCPRVLCLGQPLMPISIEPTINLYSVKMYCASCSEIYEPDQEISLDGNFFGTGLPDLFFMNFPELRPILMTEYQIEELPTPTDTNFVITTGLLEHLIHLIEDSSNSATASISSEPMKFFINKMVEEKVNDLDSELKTGLAMRVYDADENFIETKKDWFCAGALTAHYRINTTDAEKVLEKKLDSEQKAVSRRVHPMPIDKESIMPQKRQRLVEDN